MDADASQDLKQRIEHHSKAWAVEVEHVARTESSVLLFGQRRGHPVVLKVSRSPGDEWRSGEVLAAFAGRGTVRVYEHTEGAVLLERLSPGTPLAQVTLAGRDDEATQILAEVMAAMTDCTAPPATPTVADWAAGFERYADSDDTGIPRELVTEGYRAYLQLCRSQTSTRLLHGDLQHHNVLFDARRGWLSIDPKGVIGDAEFELGASLRNPYDRPDCFAKPAIVERRLQGYAARLGTDYNRALLWAFAQAVLSAVWTVEDGLPLKPENPGLLLAAAIRPMLRERN